MQPRLLGLDIWFLFLVVLRFFLDAVIKQKAKG